jgi:hypothetical protein
MVHQVCFITRIYRDIRPKRRKMYTVSARVIFSPPRILRILNLRESFGFIFAPCISLTNRIVHLPVISLPDLQRYST